MRTLVDVDVGELIMMDLMLQEIERVVVVDDDGDCVPMV